ncbi:UNVERIFIED_ORG: TetR family transcriptional regulator [Dietzia maris]|uniref:TetR family transcriptional regulator n=2 Tax=Dietziaceae TaxID=85029 RepID=A0A141AVL2_9ACTN|nr:MULTISPECIES: TetR family transcriptional regulator [Dietzia]AJW66400.1 TetR family transcriptional regulator [Dietzia sp. IMV 195]OAV77797.1 TetR family transcriptional regulator [Dietzia sp. 111N12-1]HBD22114.1 TetR/AcrR family transcriptional regulator [Dietzia sp.]MBB0996882.1 TetR/AcrR family transcriptional regulator [Dietzia maris]MDV3356922.1 TetR family transcriptional regulator [Dietzia sp. IN118]
MDTMPRHRPTSDRRSPGDPRGERRSLRSTVFEAMHELLGSHDWSSVTMSDVAQAAGLSRQTLYSTFGNRQGLAQAYALQLSETFAGEIRDSIIRHPGQIDTALNEGINGFLLSSRNDPLVRALLTGDIKPDLLRLITTEAGPLIERATEVLTPALSDSWMRIEEAQARLAASIIARIGISFISLPPNDPDQLASGLTEVIAPYLQKVIQVDVQG